MDWDGCKIAWAGGFPVKEDMDMPKFPIRESEVLALAEGMIAGYTDNPGVFPSANPTELQAKLDAYHTARTEQMELQAKAVMATEHKDTTLRALEEFMTTQLRQSEVDTKADPAALNLIGWGPKKVAQPTDPPGQPRLLEAVVQGQSSILLDWKAPQRGTGGMVRTYIVERRQSPPSGTFSEWQQAAIALETEAHLTDQPRGVQLEYRVIAVNVGGNSMPSNTAAAVL